MNAPDTVSEAVRQTWRAASCIWVLTVLALTGALAAPEALGFGRVGFDLALGLAGFVVTRKLLDGTGGLRGGVATAARWALWAVPALATVCLAVLGTGLILLPPDDLGVQAWTALWTAVGAGSLDLIKQGPWAPAVSADLLLHGWIVGVSAQLALGWALVVLPLRRFGGSRWIGPVALVGAVAAITLGVWMRGQGGDVQSFYLAPPRAWGFLLGAAAATRRWPSVSGLDRGRSALARLAPWALPFYLWVWPLLVLPRMILARALQPIEIVVVLSLAALLAWGTTRWIERPLRRACNGRPLWALLLSAGALAVVGLASAAILAAHSLPWRASEALRAETAAAQVRAPLQTSCHTEGVGLPSAEACTVPARAKADVILWGNSHGSHLSPALLGWAATRGHAVRQATRSGCLPLFDRGSGLIAAECARFNQLAVAEWGRLQPDLIVLGAGWTVVLERTPGDDAAQLDVLDASLRAMLARLRAGVGPGTRIVLLGDTPDYGFAPGACHARRAFLGLDTGRCDRAVPANATLAARVDARLEQIAAGMPGVFLFRPSTALCDGPVCRTRGPGGIWYSDRNHLTEAGGRAQTAALSAVLDHAMATR